VDELKKRLSAYARALEIERVGKAAPISQRRSGPER
jgi:hypothetical protein